MLKFSNNFERDVWYDWYQSKLHEAGSTPESAAEYADKVLEQLQKRDKVDNSAAAKTGRITQKH